MINDVGNQRPNTEVANTRKAKNRKQTIRTINASKMSIPFQSRKKSLPTDKATVYCYIYGV